MNIYEKIHSIMQNVQRLQKDDHVSFDNTNYKALSEEKVTEIMRRQLIEHKLVVFPIAQTCSRNGKVSHVDVTYRMVNVEDPSDYIEIASSGDGADSQDKGSGKAMTYAFKYMWLRTFALPTGEDPDKISSAQLDAEEKERAESELGKASPEAEKLAARALCQQAVRKYCQQNRADEKDAWRLISNRIGKASKDFTADDWRAGQKIAEGWQ